MSTWAHVVGSIRLDGLPKILPRHTAQLVREILGPISTFDNPVDTIIPNGTEGSLQYEVIEYMGGLPWIIVPIWGDLRDVGPEGMPLVKNWIQGCVSKLMENTIVVRDLAIQISVDGQDEILMLADVDTIHWKLQQIEAGD